MKISCAFIDFKDNYSEDLSNFAVFESILQALDEGILCIITKSFKKVKTIFKYVLYYF